MQETTCTLPQYVLTQDTHEEPLCRECFQCVALNQPESTEIRFSLPGEESWSWMGCLGCASIVGAALLVVVVLFLAVTEFIGR